MTFRSAKSRLPSTKRRGPHAVVALLGCMWLWIAEAQVVRPVAAGDPVLPPALRVPPDRASPSGTELRALVEAKLRRNFMAADASGSGHITRAQASAAGWGFVAQHFEEIDTQAKGQVSFDDIRRYLDRSASRR